MKQQPDPPPEEQEELAHVDDAIIGKAIRWSLVVFVLIAVLFAGAVLFLKRKPAPLPPQITKFTAPVVSGPATGGNPGGEIHRHHQGSRHHLHP